MPPKFAPRKLLVAAVGVATLNYLAVACTPSPPTSGNLPAPTAEPDSGVPPPPATVVPTSPPPTSGNLPAPQPVEPTLPDASTPTTTTAPSSSVSPVPTGSNKNVKPPFKPPRPPTAGNLMMPSGNQNK